MASLVIVGGGVGGLNAAIHARLLGFDVLLLEKGGKVGGKAAGIETQGYRLDPGPSIIILKSIYERVFREAGRRMEDYLRFQPLENLTRVYLEGRREPIDLPAGREACLRVLDDVCPGDGPAMRTLLDKLDRVAPLIDATIFRKPILEPWQLASPKLMQVGMQFDVRRTFKELVDGWFRSPLLRAFFYGFPSYGGQSYDSKAPGALLIPYYMIVEGVYYPEGGVAAIPAAFDRLARELGVEVRTGVEVNRLEAEAGRVRAAVSAEGERFEADGFISGVDCLTTGTWLGRQSEARPSQSYATFHWGLRRRLAGTDHHVLLIPSDYEAGFERLYRDRRPPLRPIVYLNDTTVLDPDTAPPGRTNLFAVLTVPACEEGLDWPTEMDRLRVAVRAEMDRWGLGFEEDEVEFERVQSPPYFEAAHGNWRGSLYGPEESARLWGLLPLRNRDESLRNLFYCGGSVQPGAGLPMVTLSGRFAAELAHKALGR